MENTYSLSDIAAASKNNDYDGFGGGAWWIIILFLFMFGMGGWNNRNANGNGDPVTEAGLCSAMNFNDLQNQVGRLSDQSQQQTQILGNGICNLGYEMQRNVGQLGKEGSSTAGTKGGVGAAASAERGTQATALGAGLMVDVLDRLNG